MLGAKPTKATITLYGLDPAQAIRTFVAVNGSWADGVFRADLPDFVDVCLKPEAAQLKLKRVMSGTYTFVGLVGPKAKLNAGLDYDGTTMAVVLGRDLATASKLLASGQGGIHLCHWTALCTFPGASSNRRPTPRAPSSASGRRSARCA